MSIKIASFKKLPPNHSYACSEIEIQQWAEDFADLRIEFGAQKSFKFDPRCNTRPKIDGIVIASLWIDRQLRPALYFYPFLSSRYPEPARQEFRERILGELKQWLGEYLAKPESEMVGREMMLVELKNARFELRRFRYL